MKTILYVVVGVLIAAVLLNVVLPIIAVLIGFVVSLLASGIGVVIFVGILIAIFRAIFKSDEPHSNEEDMNYVTTIDDEGRIHIDETGLNLYNQNPITDKAILVDQKEFNTYVSELTEKEIRDEVDQKYYSYSEQYDNQIGFGESGVFEFVGAVLLAKYDPTLLSDIDKGIEKMFKKECGPVEFSDYMDEVVEHSDVSFSMWREVYRLLVDNHNWVKNEPYASNNYRFSNRTEDFIKNEYIFQSLSKVRYIEDHLLDVQDIFDKIELIREKFMEDENYEFAIAVLDHLLFEMEEYLSVDFSYASIEGNLYWTLYMEAISDLCFEYAIFERIKGNEQIFSEFVILSVSISSLHYDKKLERAANILSIVVRDSPISHIKDNIQKNTPDTFMEKVVLFLNFIGQKKSH